MLVSKTELLEDTYHFVNINNTIYIPDWIIVYENKINITIDKEFDNVDCLFSNFTSIGGNLVLKPTDLESFDKVNYQNLIEHKSRPNYIYIFNKGILDLEKIRSKYID